MEYQAVISFDLDGTLVNARGEIHPRDVEILKYYREVCFIPATGRVLSSVRRVFARFGLLADGLLPFPLVLQNGTAMYRSGEVLVESIPFTEEIQTCLLAILRKTGDLMVLFSNPEDMFLFSQTDFGVQIAARYDLPYLPFNPDWRTSYCKMMCISDQPGVLGAIDRATRGLDVERAYSMPIILEVTPAGTGKGSGLKRLLPMIGLNQVPVYAVGDGGNDLSLFDLANLAFAPNNSPANIQARAYRVVDPEPEGILAPVLKAIGLPVSFT